MSIEKLVNLDFPTAATMRRRFGGHSDLLEKVRSHCVEKPGNEDVLSLLSAHKTPKSDRKDDVTSADAVPGYVYLMKSGRYYKIGRSNDAGRRGYEIRLQQPEAVEEVWKIKTDDPEGIEAYWHRRFADRRKNGEWFDLRKADVNAFKRWRRIC